MTDDQKYYDWLWDTWLPAVNTELQFPSDPLVSYILRILIWREALRLAYVLLKQQHEYRGPG